MLKGKVKCVSNKDWLGGESDYLTVGKVYDCEFEDNEKRKFSLVDDEGSRINEDMDDLIHGMFTTDIGVIYIAGPMTGLPNFNREAFFRKQMSLRLDGWTVISPHVLPSGLKDTNYMDICMAMVRSANAVYMLRNWEESHGAYCEYVLAKKLGLDIYYEDEE